MGQEARKGSRWVTKLTRLNDADPSVDRAVMAAMGPEERIARVWQLVLRHGRLIGVDYAQQRLQRSVEHIHRGKT